MKSAWLLLLALGATNVAAKPTFDAYLAGLKEEALAQGLDAAMVEHSFATITYRAKTIVHDKAQPERKKITLDAYIPRAVPDWKIVKARELYAEHETLLDQIGKDFGVQPRFVVALWGIETNFGSYTGNFSTLSALATLAYDGRREAFFKKEFFAALNIIAEGHISVEDMQGSWAGAMGQVQFMPSSFNAYAVDYDKDGKKDIWNNTADALASAANYLKQANWDDNYTWGRQVLIPDSLDPALIGLKHQQKLSEWQELGVVTYEGKSLPQVDINASLIMPDGKDGRVFLVYNNYKSIMRWNRSDYFATSVAHLADTIKFRD